VKDVNSKDLIVMPKQMLLCTTHSLLDATNVMDWLKNEGFSNREISACVPEVKRTAKNPIAGPRNQRAGAKLCGPVTWKAAPNRVPPADRRSLFTAGAVARILNNASVGAALVARGLPPAEAEHYEVKIQSGGILISINTGSSNELHRAKKIFEMAGMDDIATVPLAGRSRAVAVPSAV
jgi:hypothetical protein